MAEYFVHTKAEYFVHDVMLVTRDAHFDHDLLDTCIMQHCSELGHVMIMKSHSMRRGKAISNSKNNMGMYSKKGIPAANVAMVCQGWLRLIASLAVPLTLQCNHLVPLQHD